MLAVCAMVFAVVSCQWDSVGVIALQKRYIKVQLLPLNDAKLIEFLFEISFKIYPHKYYSSSQSLKYKHALRVRNQYVCTETNKKKENRALAYSCHIIVI